MINKVTLIGRLGQDVELRYTQAQKATALMSVATSESWFDKQSQERKDSTEWHRVQVWDKQAENCQKYLKKGSMVYIEGKIKTEKYTDKQGIERYATKIQAREVKFLDPKSDSTQQTQAPVTPPFPQNNQPPQQQQQQTPARSIDDIPF